MTTIEDLEVVNNKGKHNSNHLGGAKGNVLRVPLSSSQLDYVHHSVGQMIPDIFLVC